MKKGLLLFTGILELIFFILVLILSIFNLAYQFLASTLQGFMGAEISGMFLDVFVNMYKPLIDFLPLSLEPQLMNIILAGLMIILSLMLVIFASRKLAIAKLEDSSFFEKRKSITFFAIFEFLMFAGAVATFVVPTLTYGFMFIMLETIPQGVNIFVTFLVFLLTAIQSGKMRKGYKESYIPGLTGAPAGNATYPQTTGYTQQFGPNPTGQGMYAQPAEPQQTISHYQPNMIDKTEDVGDLYVGYPDKVKADLERLDRLYANGALTQDSFQAMRTKIMQTIENSNASSGNLSGGDAVAPAGDSGVPSGNGDIPNGENNGTDVPPQA